MGLLLLLQSAARSAAAADDDDEASTGPLGHVFLSFFPHLACGLLEERKGRESRDEKSWKKRGRREMKCF